MATGDIRIDALVESARPTLATGHTLGAGALITFSFLSSAPIGSAVYDFRSLNDTQKDAVRVMLTEVASVIGVTFQENASGGLLQYGMYTGRPGIPLGPDNKAESITSDNGSLVWLNWQTSETQNLGSGYGRQLLLHETAHSLGLKHPEAYSNFDTGPYLPAGAASAAHTIMAYNVGNTEHLGDYDVAALQYLYGGPGSVLSTGTTVNVASPATTASYFNDTISLDTNAFPGSASIKGLTGLDTLTINVASSKASFQAGLKQFTYSKVDGGFAGVFLDGVERVRFTDKSIALDIDGNAGQAYRLYKAAFDRTPDIEGLSFWIKQIDKGASLESVSAGFIGSQEFQNINGESPTNLQLVTSLYQHILGRAPDQSGLDFWTHQLDTNSLSKSNLLVNFSESGENKIALTGQVAGGIEYIG